MSSPGKRLEPHLGAVPPRRVAPLLAATWAGDLHVRRWVGERQGDSLMASGTDAFHLADVRLPMLRGNRRLPLAHDAQSRWSRRGRCLQGRFRCRSLRLSARGSRANRLRERLDSSNPFRRAQDQVGDARQNRDRKQLHDKQLKIDRVVLVRRAPQKRVPRVELDVPVPPGERREHKACEGRCAGDDPHFPLPDVHARTPLEADWLLALSQREAEPARTRSGGRKTRRRPCP